MKSRRNFYEWSCLLEAFSFYWWTIGERMDEFLIQYFFWIFRKKNIRNQKKISKKTNGSSFALETSMLADSCSNWYTSLKCRYSNSLFNGHQISYIEHVFILILRIFHFSMKGGEIHMAHISQFWRFAQLWKLIFLWRS